MKPPLLFALGSLCGLWLGSRSVLERAGAAGARAARDILEAEQREWHAERRGVRGIRGAITVERDEPAAILAATSELLQEIVRRNHVDPADVASALFTVTQDLSSEFPAAAARTLGWTRVPLLNFVEIDVPGRLERCIRTLVHVNTASTQAELEHVYLGKAVTLRPDLASRSAQ